ncbi:nucleoside permease [Bacillus cereus]|uniref:nucleoside permease n=2 Tax=Bacillus cereus TaxID=1396 RepID=UPI000BECDCD3|nr:nucleoside permease [Bacillus cereus]PDY73592.1 nucleoside permease [Bacillus cereus]PFP85857.1 nucleoside permease [Bacillus cereus]
MALNRWLTDEERARAKANGISKDTLYYRIYRTDKWELEEALTAPPGTIRHNYKGKYEKWLRKAQENGINASTFYSRINVLGWGYEEAATKSINEAKVERRRWIDIAKQNGIGYSTFMSRVNIHGWDLEKAATKPINTRRRSSKKDKEEAL